MTSKKSKVVYLQSKCLLKYSERKSKSLDECSFIFKQHNIFRYLSECYDYLHFFDIVFLVSHIDDVIEKGIVYSKRNINLFDKGTKEIKEYCMHNLVSMVVEKLHAHYPQYSEIDLISEFSQSRTYALLFDLETGLWKEGPDYILSLYTKEKCKNKVK